MHEHRGLREGEGLRPYARDPPLRGAGLPCRLPPGAASTFLLLFAGTQSYAQSTSINGHAVVRDGQQKIVTWMTPAATAFDRFLDQRWSFIKTGVPMSPGPAPRSSYPLYYFFNGYPTTSSTIEPDWWMNDVGEKIPNWFESARLYYAYTGDASVMQIATGLVDYALAHGTSASTFAWPNFPYTTDQRRRHRVPRLHRRGPLRPSRDPGRPRRRDRAHLLPHVPLHGGRQVPHRGA